MFRILRRVGGVPHNPPLEPTATAFGEHARLNFPNAVDAWLEQQAQAPKREAA